MLRKHKDISRGEAIQRTAKHKRDFKGLRKGWVRLGKDVAESVDLGVPAKLGMTMRDWLDKTFEESSSHIFRQLQNIRALKGVPQEKLEQISEGNAHQLTRLPEKMRKAPAMIEKAATLPTTEFRDHVDEVREKKFGIKRDEWRTHAVRLPLAVYDLIVEAEKKIANVIQVDIEDEQARAGNLIAVWEAIASLVNETPDEWLIVELVGGDAPCAPTHRVETLNSRSSDTKPESTSTLPVS